ncbi:ABC transporter substrate-binding protein [Agromyces silvae]|uniref:ABC transporter substrate-binding protein n=1 Tax=Agromyces silvae TaxID=3388266 RepID=UPI00280A7DEB|nr:extracellular solute-binding protein [Agromyces protaetiae]
MRRPLIGIGAAAAALVVLAGCGTGGTGPQSQTTADDISTEMTDEPVTLTISYASDPPITPLVEGFTELYPNVTIELVQTPFADYQTSLKLALGSDDAPDIVQYSPGPMRSIVPAGLVEKLDGYADAYGWRDQVDPSLLGMLTSNETATEYGTGDLYAVPGAIQLIGVFYNKGLVDAAGIEGIPETLADFEADLAAVQASGVSAPVAMPAFGIGGFQLWGALASVLGDVDEFNAWVYGKDGATLTENPGFTEAAALVQEWAAAGYFTSGAAAVADADAISAFQTGQNAYYVTGNWNTKVFDEALGDDLGFFLLPGASASTPAVATASGFPYSISSRSEHKNVAAAFLNFIVGQDAAAGVVESGFVPVTPNASDGATGVPATIQDAYLSVIDGGGTAPFANWATSSMIDTLTSGAQGLINGTTTPEAFVESLQADWESNRP